MAREAIGQTRGKRFILSTGCAEPITTPLASFRAARKAVGAS